MATRSERLEVLVTPAQKARIAAMAKEQDLSVCALLRRAAESYRPDDEVFLQAMVGQLAKSTAQASAAIDDAMAYVAASNRRIAAMDAQARASASASKPSQ